MRLINSIIGVFLIGLLLIPAIIFGQQSDSENTLLRLTKADSVYASKLPKLSLPQLYRSGKAKDLPYELNNSILPFLRPAFTQEGYWNCGQAAGIGYNFTYEINAARGLSGDTSINQYTPGFTFNFMNGGYGWGVSYFNSFDALKDCGNPTIFDYGGIYNYGQTGWMSGYELYENAMENRIDEIYSIDVGTPEGLLTLKYWLLNHLNGSEYGGVANFYFGFYWSANLPLESPDAGFPVVIESSPVSTHAMTIVGYNDSIRYDINNDGQFTNDIDINGDTIVDMKDWEIGGLRYMNSTFQNDGAGYLMYRTLALESGSGGIWNNQMHVITVKESYEPLVNLRLKIKHNSRNKLKIIAGVSTDTTHNYPEFTMDFPIFNYQGGDHYMQGIDTTESQKTIELALDISPLLTYVSVNNPTKFFVQIAENDKYNYGEGEILYYSIVDRTDGISEIVCNEVPVSINDNAITTLKVTHVPLFEKVEITTEVLPAISPGVNQIVQIEAESGYPPYNWEVLNPYTLNQIQSDFPQIDNEQLEFEENYDSRVEIELPFLFPYYGDTVQYITIYIDGFIMFDNEPYTYPYFVGEETLLKGEKVISPFMSEMMLNAEDNDGIWVNKSDEYVGIRWKTSAETDYGSSDVNFSVLLYPDGKIRTYYGLVDYPETRLWAVGISSGDNTNYVINQMGHRLDEISNTAFEYVPTLDLLPTSLSINQSGELSVLYTDSSAIYPITVQVKDNFGITDVNTYNLSSSGLVFNYEIEPGENNIVDYNDTSTLNISVYNNSSNTFEDVLLKFSSSSTFVTLGNIVVNIGTVQPQQSIEISNATTFTILPQVPDGYNSIIHCDLVTDNNQWTSNINLAIKAPDFKIIDTQIIDNDDQLLYPGETAIMKIIVQNAGHSRSAEMTSNLVSNYDHVNIVSMGSNTINALAPGDTDTVEFIIAAGFKTPMGTQIQLKLGLFINETAYNTLNISLRVGLVPVLIIDPDPDQISGLQFREILNELRLVNTYSRSVPGNLDDYMAVFVCLGSFFINHKLTDIEGALLTDYLQSSGMLYMEGGYTWVNTNQTDVHPHFNIHADSPGIFVLVDTILGVDEYYTKDMIFEITDNYSYSNFFIHPNEGATTFFNSDISDTSGVVIANQHEGYKTIGSSIQFGKLVNTDTVNTKEDYLIRILEFFGISKYIYINTPEVLYTSDNNISIKLYPNPVKDILTIKFFNSMHKPSMYQILNIHGKLIKEQIMMESISVEKFTTNWNCKDKNGRSLPKGIYLLRYISGKQSVTKKVVLN